MPRVPRRLRPALLGNAAHNALTAAAACWCVHVSGKLAVATHCKLQSLVCGHRIAPRPALCKPTIAPRPALCKPTIGVWGCAQVYSKLASGRVPSVGEILAAVAGARESPVQG